MRLEKLYRDHLRLAQASPLTPSLSPARSGGEGARRAGEGVHRFEDTGWEEAALVAVARTLLNLDEFVTRE